MNVSSISRYLSIATAAAVFINMQVSPAAAFERQDIRLYSGWKYHNGGASGAEAAGYNDGSWETVSLPHPKEFIPVDGADYTQGDCWYRKIIPSADAASFAGKKVFLRFDGAMQTSDIYINGTKKLTHLGGYSPFVIDISAEAQSSGNIVIAARLNNAPSALFPPSNPNPDFSYFGGLYRNVYLQVADKLHITDPIFADKEAGGGVFVTYPSVSSASAMVQVKTHIINEYADPRTCMLNTKITDASGAQAAAGEITCVLPAGKDTTLTQQIQVANPHLWHPEHPYMYTVVSRVYDDNREADIQATQIGIRTIKFTRANGFEINGERFIFRGANRHQEYPFVGNAVPASGHYRDALRLKEGGFDFVRTCHYTQAREFFDACDRLGVMAMVCLPGWQWFEGNQQFFDNSVGEVRTMVRWHRNHPSVILWESVPNETYPNESFCAVAHQAAKAEYPGDQMYTCGEEENGVMDVYVSSTQHGVRENGGIRPVQISECGDWEYGGASSSSRQSRADGESGMLTQCGNHIETYNQNRGCSWLTGDALWALFDYQGFQRPLRCGSQDMYRLPKYSWYFFRSQRDPGIAVAGADLGPNAFIACNWTAQSNMSVKVFSNCEQVSLYRNGTLVATQGPDQANETANCEHPPFTFAVGSFAAGELVAQGKIGGTVQATHTVRTPGTAVSLVVHIDTAHMRLQADGSDFAMVYAMVVDEKGTVLPGATNQVQFSASGAGGIYGTNPVAAEAGIATVIVRSQTSPGEITVTAQSPGLTGASASVTSVPASEQVPLRSILIADAAQHAPRAILRMTARNTLAWNAPLDGRPVMKLRIYSPRGRLVCEKTLNTAAGTAVVPATAAGIYCSELVAGGKRIAAAGAFMNVR